MAVTNNFQNTSLILTEFMAQLQNQMQFALTANRNFTEDYSKAPLRKGATLTYRLPYQFTVGNQLAVTTQNTDDRVRTITVDQIRNIALEFNGLELTLEDAMKDPFSKQYQMNQMNYLANNVESYIAKKFYKKSTMAIGTPGATVTSSTIGDAREKMVKMAIPVDGGNLFGALNASASNSLANSVNNFFNPKVNSAALENGYLGELKGFQFFETVHLPRHIAGVGAGQAVTGGKRGAGHTSAQVTSGSVIPVDGLNATASGYFFREGDIIQLTGVQSLNALTGEATGDEMQFTVTADVPANGGGSCNIPVSPAIITSGKGKNCEVIPSNTAVILYTDHNVSLFYHKEALYYAAPMLEPPRSLVIKGKKYDSKYRMGITYSEGADIKEFTNINRIDHLFGTSENYEFLVRVMS